MARTNVALKQDPIRTHEGGLAKRTDVLNQLRRSVLSCLLWENEFYEDGEEISKRISSLVAQVAPAEAHNLAVAARNEFKLRHVPLWIAVAMCRAGSEHRRMVGHTLFAVIQRPDEIPEFLSLYWKDGKVPLAKQVKRGLAGAFTKFNEHQLAKWNRDDAIKLRDALFLVHAHPTGMPDELGRGKVSKPTKHRGSAQRHSKGMGLLFKKLADKELETPDTWEVGLSAATSHKEKAAVWTRLIKEGKLGALALLRNIRNMTQVDVGERWIVEALKEMKVDRILPFRFITAARYNPAFEEHLETAMFRCLDGTEKLPGTTVLVVDVSGSMNDPLSGKSDLRRLDAAYGLAILCRELCENVKIFSFSSSVQIIPPRRGFALRDAIDRSQPHGSTYLKRALTEIDRKETYDRIVVITDEQSHDGIFDPACKNRYLINVGSCKNGVGYGGWWTHLDGFSEAVFQWICENERVRDEGFWARSLNRPENLNMGLAERLTKIGQNNAKARKEIVKKFEVPRTVVGKMAKSALKTHRKVVKNIGKVKPVASLKGRNVGARATMKAMSKVVTKKR